MSYSVFIQTNHKQIIGALVAEYALRRNSHHSDAFDVRIMHTHDYPFFKAREGQLYLRDGVKRTWLNDELAGDPDAGPEMHFSFHDLLQHIAKTRGFTAGTLLGSGTISNRDEARGVSCLAERRVRQIIADGKPNTPCLKAGDRVRIQLDDAGGRNVFGTIEQNVVAP